jgi:hypothetical protein
MTAGAVLGLLGLGAVIFTIGTTRVQIESAERNFKETAQLHERLAALDRTHGWTRGDDLALVELTAADLDRYLRVRRSLEPALREIDRRQTEIRRKRGQAGGLGELLTTSSAFKHWQEAQAGFLRSLVTALERENMGPRELDNLIALVEWRFLRRSEALVFGLPEYQRADWVAARQGLSFDVPEGDGTGSDFWIREARKRRDRLQAKADALEKQAQAAVVLSPVTQTLLASRRTEVEALDAQALSRIAHGLDQSLGMESPWSE